MEIILIKAIQFLLSISLLVVLHEAGHAGFSKLFGVRVEKFFLFMDLGIGKWSGALFKFKPKNSDTVYGVGWLPFGGYCKLSGMIDESFDTAQMAQPAQPWEFRTKPAWQRLLIMIGGVLVNFVLALFIYSMIMYHWGESYVRMADMHYGMKFNTEAKKMGFKDHDIILGTDKGTFRDFNVDVYRNLSEAQWCDVMRDGKRVRVALPGNINLLDMLKTTPQFMSPFIPAVVDSVLRTNPADATGKQLTAAYRIGLKKNDVILAVNGKAIDSYNEFTEQMGIIEDQLMAAKTHADSVRLQTVALTVRRAGQNQRIDTLQAKLNADLKFGFATQSLGALYENKVTHINYSFLASFPAGVRYGWNVLSDYVSDMKYIFTADGVKSLGGFATIGNLFPSTWDWYLFWKMTAFLSIILAFMNILPIPAFDGGHVMFLLYEVIVGRKPSEGFMVKAEYAGFGFIILLMIIANLNDVLRWLGVM